MKNSFWIILLVVCSIFFFLFINCIDLLEVGVELLDEDCVSVGFIDMLKLVVCIEIVDFFFVFFFGVGVIFDFFFGCIESDYFGIIEVVVYFEFFLLCDLGGNFVEFFIDFIMVFLDLVVLVFFIDFNGIYGFVNGQFGVEVYEVMEVIELIEVDGSFVFFFNVFFDVNLVLIVLISFCFNYIDFVFVKKQIDFIMLDIVDLNRLQVCICLDDVWG